MYAKINNNQIEIYPYTLQDLRNDIPNVSFPETMSDSDLLSWNVVNVVYTIPPTYDYTQNLKEVTPTLINGIWTQTWQLNSASADEISNRVSNQANTIRLQRNLLLKECDFTQCRDISTNPNTDPWIPYRKALRDITTQSGFPFNVVWPTKPNIPVI